MLEAKPRDDSRDAKRTERETKSPQRGKHRHPDSSSIARSLRRHRSGLRMKRADPDSACDQKDNQDSIRRSESDHRNKHRGNGRSEHREEAARVAIRNVA